MTRRSAPLHQIQCVPTLYDQSGTPDSVKPATIRRPFDFDKIDKKKSPSNPLPGDNQSVPTIFEQDGYRFFFYSNDHRPIHVHVRYGGGEAVFDIQEAVELRESFRLKTRELARAQELAEKHRRLIIDKWHEHLD